jgi:hypothetical protein
MTSGTKWEEAKKPQKKVGKSFSFVSLSSGLGGRVAGLMMPKDFYCGQARKVLLSFLWIWKL